MKSDNNASDRRLHDRVPATAAAVVSTDDDHDDDHDDPVAAYSSSNQDGDREVDLEVNRFLESEFFTMTQDKTTPAASGLHFGDETAFNAFSLREEDDALFMDLNGSIEMPDLDFGDAVDQAFVGFRAQEIVTSTAKIPTVTTKIATETPRAMSSLRVLIPASALFAPSPGTYHRELQDAKPTPMRSSTPTGGGRKRVKDELEYLRQQVQEFEYKLERLRRVPDGDEGLSPSLSLSTASLNLTERAFDETTPPSSLWERIAKHQKDEKQKSAAENLRLKEMLESQLKLARSLSKVLRRRHDLSWLETKQTPQAGQAMKKLRVTTASDDTGMFELLAVQVDTLYSELDAVLCEAGLAGPGDETVTQGGQVKTDPEGSVFIEVVDCNVLPFDFHTTGAAIWKLMTTSSMNFDNGQYQAIDATEDTFRALLNVSLEMRRVDTEIQMRVVGKRIVEADRVVLVWCAMGDTQGGNDYVRVRESGWTVVKADTSGGQGEPLTTVQSILRMVPELEASGIDSKSPTQDCVGVLTDVVLSSFHQNLATMRQMIENLILSDAVAAASN